MTQMILGHSKGDEREKASTWQALSILNEYGKEQLRSNLEAGKEQPFWSHTRTKLGLRLVMSLLLIMIGVNLWGQTEITSLSGITDTDGHYIITQDITGGAPSVSTFNGILEAAINPATHMPYRIKNLSAPLFTTVTGTVKNLVFENVDISSGSDVGAVASTANGDARIYNIGVLSGQVGGSGNVGSLVGLLDGTARVINCYSYANITSGGSTTSPQKYVGGLVGNNNQTSTQDAIKTIVVNCMFYGEISTTQCANYAPVYGNKAIENNKTKKVDNVTIGIGINPYCYFLGTAAFQSSLADINAYKRSWPADEEYLTRFEYYRSILNSNRQLCAFWVTGNTGIELTSDDAKKILKWVLDPSIAKYPILKEWGKYSSIINPDPDRTWDPEANGGAGAWQTRSTAAPYRGKRFTETLSVTVNPGGHAASGVTSKDITLPITDMDTLNHDYGYYKVQLPYYNELFGNPSSTNHDTRYGGNYKDYVVTGWKITEVNGETSGTTTFVKNWESGYNFADRTDKFRDLYTVSDRVFAQGGYYYVPEGVTSITIEAYWGKAVYLHNTGHYLDRVNITSSSGNRTVGSPFSSAGTLATTFQGQTVWDAWHTAVTKLDAASLSNGLLNKTVYDQAIVLLSNFQIRNENGAVGYGIDNKWHPYTIMSIDQDLDNEPDYCFEFQFRNNFNRPGIQPIRFDFLPVPELGLAVRHNAQQNTIGIFVPQGHFEITETSYMHLTQFEYDALASGTSAQVCGTKIPAPIILNGGHFEQIVVRYGPQNTTQYFLMGGHFRMLRFTPGAHTNRGQSAQVRLCAVNAIGGEYPEFYLSGIYRPDIVPNTNKNPHCYTNGGKFNMIAGAGYDKINGNITFKIDHSYIGEFYGGGINGANPVDGDIDVTIDHSLVGKYCGGPKVGTMATGKTVKTSATGTIFTRFYGGGNGGTSYYRDQGYDGNDYNLPTDESGWIESTMIYNNKQENAPGSKAKYKDFNPLNILTGTKSYDATKGYHALFEFECFVESNGLGGKPTLRTYTHWAQFGTTSTGNITNELTDCTIKGDFYGGGNLGNVSGSINSILTDCTINGNVFGGGYSGRIEPFRIHDKSKTTIPYYDKSGVMHNGSLPYLKDGTEDRYYTWIKNIPAEWNKTASTSSPTFQGPDGTWYAYTTVSLDGLGEVSQDASLTITTTEGGTSTIGTLENNGTLKAGTGNVFGGGNESAVNGNTRVTLSGNVNVRGNVFGGGNKANVGGSSIVNIEE